jgi:hypothetical protein
MEGRAAGDEQSDPALALLAPNARITKGALRDLKKLPRAATATLLDPFRRRCTNGYVGKNEDESLPGFKGGKFGSIRKKLDKNNLRLIYASAKLRPRVDQSNTSDKDADAPTYVFVGVVAWMKKRPEIPDKDRKLAQQRFAEWLKENPEYVAG